MEGNESICLPTIQADSRSPQGAEEFADLHDPDCSSLNQPASVSRAPGPAVPPPSTYSRVAEARSSTSGECFPSQPPNVAPSHVATVRSRIRQAGFLMQLQICRSTTMCFLRQTVPVSLEDILCLVSRTDINPSGSIVQQVAAFLVYRFEVKKLPTIDLSSIALTLEDVEGIPLLLHLCLSN